MLTCWHNCHCRHANYICLVQISSSRLKQRLVYVYRLVLQWGSTNKACLDQTGNLWAFLKGNAYWHHTGVSIRINWHQISMFVVYADAFGLWKIPEFSISIGDSPMHCNVFWSQVIIIVIVVIINFDSKQLSSFSLLPSSSSPLSYNRFASLCVPLTTPNKQFA